MEKLVYLEQIDSLAPRFELRHAGLGLEQVIYGGQRRPVQEAHTPSFGQNEQLAASRDSGSTRVTGFGGFSIGFRCWPICCQGVNLFVKVPLVELFSRFWGQRGRR